MLPRLERFLLGPRFACIEAELQEHKTLYHLTVLNRKGNNAAVVLMEKNIADGLTLVKQLERHIPVALIVTGRGVINRRYNGTAEISDETLLRSVLPNAAADDVLLSRFAVDENSGMVSIARKSVVQQITEELKGISFVAVLVGPCVTLSMLDLFDGIEQELSCASHTFRFNEGVVNEVLYRTREETRSVKLGEERVAEENLVSFAGALQGLTHTSRIPGEAAGFAEWRRNFIRMKRYGASVKGSVAAALLVLLINFFFFTHYRNLKAELESDPRINAVSFQRFHELNEKLLNNKEFFAASGLTGNTSFAWIADQLAAGVPGDIVLTRVNMAPAETFGRTDTLGFHPQRMVIAGSCRQSASLNAWLKQLQHETWISSAAITSYSDAGNSNGKFELALAFR